MKFKFVLSVLFVAMTFVFLTSAMAGDDPVKVAPKNYRVLLENDEVRVLDFTGKAGDMIPMHSHPDHTVYVIHGGKGRFTSGGKSTDVDMKDGEALFFKAGDHSVELLSDTHVIVVEMKEEMMKK